jgi:tetratricopeptide (TPR) repeat protein
VTRALIVFAMLVGARVAYADDAAGEPEPQPDPGGHVAKARELHDRGDFVAARVELLAAYDASPQPALLFALGQIEFNLRHFKAAIDYYERFEATNPPPKEAALALQAIGAARIELARPAKPPDKPRPPPHKQWDATDTGLVVGGAAAIVAAGGLVLWSQHVANERTGSLQTYDRRITRAEIYRYSAIGGAAAGAIVIGAALLRYQLRLVETGVEVHPMQGGVTFAFERSW